MVCSLLPGGPEDPVRHRLVIVEGIMGSGKSTTMRFIAKSLQEANRRALPIHERTDPHPVRATDELEHWFQPWLDTTPEHLAQRSVARWAAFVENMQAGDVVPVMDGQLFHGDLTHVFLMDADASTIERYMQALATAIAPLNPLVVYFRQEDVEEAIALEKFEHGGGLPAGHDEAVDTFEVGGEADELWRCAKLSKSLGVGVISTLQG